MTRWKKAASEEVFHHSIFDLERQQLVAGERRQEVIVVRAPDWINVIPLLDDGRVVLIRQWRYGIAAPTLEIPGGLVDSGESAAAAAARELEEETGYRAQRWERLGVTHPNPAFLSNRLTTFLATGLRQQQPERRRFGVDGERITVESAPIDSIPALIRDGVITHALVIAAFHLFDIGQGS